MMHNHAQAVWICISCTADVLPDTHSCCSHGTGVDAEDVVPFGEEDPDAPMYQHEEAEEGDEFERCVSLLCISILSMW